MAERRMFSKTIVDSDVFLDLPLSSQALYFHLGMRADDDGFVSNPKKIAKMIGSSEDDAKLLVFKKLIMPFETGIIVITHWKQHNYIQKDRYKTTVYQAELKKLCVNDGVYSLDTKCIQSVSSLETQVSIELELDQDSLSPYLSPQVERETKISFQEFRSRLAEAGFVFELTQTIAGYLPETKFKVKSTGYIHCLKSGKDVSAEDAKELWDFLYQRRSAVLAAIEKDVA